MWRVLNSRQERTCPTLSKQYPDEFKAMVVELYKSGKPASEIMREYGLTSSTFYKWTKAKAELAVDGQKMVRGSIFFFSEAVYELDSDGTTGKY